MVYNFTIWGGPCLGLHSHITLSSADITCYVGEDKHENEFLIKYAWPGDIWFHVDSLSSAHVYFRVYNNTAETTIPIKGIPIDDLPTDSVSDMMQIVKHNSISGCKLASTKIVYTPASNLKKTFQMDSGTVTYHDPKMCRYARCDKDKGRIKELEATKVERQNVNFFEEQQANERRIVERKKREKEERRNEAAHATAYDMVRQSNDQMGLYDPMREDMHSAKMKATRVGDFMAYYSSTNYFMTSRSARTTDSAQQHQIATAIAKTTTSTTTTDQLHQITTSLINKDFNTATELSFALWCAA
jgi:hypothetical protein